LLHLEGFDVAGIVRCKLALQCEGYLVLLLDPACSLGWTHSQACFSQPTCIFGLLIFLYNLSSGLLSETGSTTASVPKTGYETGYGINKSSGLLWFHGRLRDDFLFNV
jgi:hypothetical protein